jgi:hypothetical protein
VEREDIARERRQQLEHFDQGRDELNLAEFPLAAICDRFLDGTKTVVFEDTVWDEDRRAQLPRKLTISGSDRYGLPTARDDDVLLACVQLSSLGDFHSRQVHFSRYELLKLLRWPNETRYYRRLSVSLRRWKGLTVYSDRAFFDKARRSWVNKDFGIFDNLYIYEREEGEGASAPASSWLVWNEVMFDSFQAGYLKKLDWDLYCRLENPVAKRLYRFLDKRFYWGDEVRIDLHELAFNKVRMSRNYNTGQVKRVLEKGIEELESQWDLRKTTRENRFQKGRERGKWEAVFVRRRPQKLKPNEVEPSLAAAIELETELAKREIGPAAAKDLVAAYPRERILTMIALYDWHNSRGQERGPGFLVAGIKSKEPYVLPRGFRAAQRNNAAPRPRGRKKRKSAIASPAIDNRAKESESEFERFWKTLSPERRAEFEHAALAQADRTKLDGYHRCRQFGGVVFESYRQVILADHFARRREEAKDESERRGRTSR